MPTAACRCCGCRRRTTIWRRSGCRAPACGRRDRHRYSRHRRLKPRRPDAGAACRPCGAGRRRTAGAAAPPFHRQSRCRQLWHDARKAAACDDAFRCDLEIRRHRRDVDADHRRAVGGEGRGAGNAHPRHFSRNQRAGQSGQANGLRDLLGQISRADARSRSRRRRPLFGAHQCRAAAGGDARPRHCRGARRRRACAGAGAGEEAGGASAGRGRRRARGCAGREQGQDRSAC